MIYSKIQDTIPYLFEAVGCLCLFDNTLLLLRRNEGKSYPRHWGIPSGKKREHETRTNAAIRELFEETGLIRSSHNLTYLKTYHIINEDMSFLYSMYSCNLSTLPDIKINKEEHNDFGWYKLDELAKLLLVPDSVECVIDVLPYLKRPSVQLSLFPESKPSTNFANFVSPKTYTGLSSFHKYWGKKPIESMSYLIEICTNEGDIVMDPFLGSGLISRECLLRNRRFIGIDINPFSIEYASFLLDLPSRQEFYQALIEVENSVAEKINSTYLTLEEQIASHYLWEGNEIVSVWVKPKTGRKRIEIEPSEVDDKAYSTYKKYTPQQFRNLKFFTNSRINVKPTMSISDILTGRAMRNIDLLIKSFCEYPPRLKRSLLLTLTASVGQMSNMVFAIKNPRAPSHDLLEFNHGADAAVEDDIAHIAGIHTGGEHLRRGEDGGDIPVVVLEAFQQIAPCFSLIASDTNTVVWIGNGFVLVDHVPHGQGVALVGAEDDGFLQRLDMFKYGGGDQLGALIGDDLFIEVFGFVDILVRLAPDDLIITGQYQLVQIGANAHDAIGGQETVIDALFQRVLVGGLTEIVVGVDVVAAFGRGGQADMHGG